ncbi:hypothetical protein [Enterococcus sp. AZ103]|uniref:hypothetical protein n=1 Tax=Enterococcus sp. AZ103 TaxID=2774628 RepID=UPI003F2446F4
MNPSAYKQARALHEQYSEEINKLIQIHKNDPDLFHPLGKDKNCAYCDRYKKILSKQKENLLFLETYEKTYIVDNPLIQQVKKVEEKKSPPRKYAIYSLTFKDGSEFIVHACSQQAACNATKRSEESLSKAIIIKKDYYNSIYLEKSNGAVTSLTSSLSSRSKNKNYVLAEMQQTKLKFSGVCFNETPIEFFKYSPERVSELIAFVGNIPLTKTKKFNLTGKVALQTKHGGMSLEPGHVLLKIGRDIFITMSAEEFINNFVEDEALVWIEKN